MGLPYYESLGINTTTSDLVSNNTGASANVLSPWYDIGTTTFDHTSQTLLLSTAGAKFDSIVNLCYGPLYTNLVSGLYIPASDSTSFVDNIPLQLFIPKGQVVRYQVQGNTATSTYKLGLIGKSETYRGAPFRYQVAYGYNISTSGATTIDAGATTNTKGVWTTIGIASETHQSLMLVLAPGNYPLSPGSGAYFLVDIGIGTVGSPEVIIPNINLCVANSLNPLASRQLGPYSIDVPAGAAIQVRSQCSVGSTPGRLLKMCAVCGSKPIYGSGGTTRRMGLVRA